MERLEEMIRESLEARAGDVEPTPELWERVDARIARRRWLTVGAWSVTAAAAVLVAAVVVPGLVRQPLQPDVADTPAATAEPASTPHPTDPPTTRPDASERPTTVPTQAPVEDATFAPGLRGGVPGWDRDGDLVPDVYVAIEGAQRVVVRGSADDALLAELHPEVGPEGEGSFTGLAVRPGAEDALVVAVGYEGEGERDVLVWRWDGEVLEERVVWVGGPGVPPSRLSLAWSEDGGHLAWATGEGDLRVAPVAELFEVPTEAGAVGDVGTTLELGRRGLTVLDWSWSERDGDRGMAVVTFTDLDGAGYAVLDVDGPTVSLGSLTQPGWGAAYGSVDAHLSPGAAVGPEYQLDVVGGELSLGWGGDGDRSGAVGLGGDTSAGPGAWLTGFGRGVLVGKADGVWLSVADFDDLGHGASSRPLPGAVRFAAFVPFPVDRDD